MSLRQVVAKSIFPFNEKIVNGIAATELARIVEYLDKVLADIARVEFPKGVEYTGITMMDPKDAYEEYVQLRHNKSKRIRTVGKKLQKRGYEIMDHDFYAIEINIRFNGVDMKPRPLFIPTVRWKSKINSRGSRFNISQIVADVAMSIKNNVLYVPFQKTKLQVNKKPIQLLRNNLNYQGFMMVSRVYKGGNTYLEKKETSIAHYVFVKYGVREAFRKYAKCQVHIGYDNEITTELYPVDGYDIFSLPSGSPIRLSILRSSRTLLTDMLITSMFYGVSCFPEQLTVETIDDTYLWKHLLGIIILGKDNSTNASSVMNEHINSVDKYVCDVTRRNYNTSGILINDFYDLMVYIMENYATIYDSGVSGSMYGQQIKLLPYIVAKITSKFTTLAYGLNKEYNKGKLNEGTLAQALGRSLTPKSLFDINSLPCVNAANSSSDNCYFDLTELVLQDQASSGGKGKTKINPNDPKVALHPSTLESGRPLAPKSSEPIGKFGNACVNLDDNLVIIPHPHMVEDMNRLCALLEIETF